MINEVSIQNQLLNLVRKEKTLITVFLVSQKKFIGYVVGFDRYTIHLRCRDFDHIIFKHAITNITVPKSVMQKLPLFNNIENFDSFESSIPSEEHFGDSDEREER
jgi:host factor-I protein